MGGSRGRLIPLEWGAGKPLKGDVRHLWNVQVSGGLAGTFETFEKVPLRGQHSAFREPFCAVRGLSPGPAPGLFPLAIRFRMLWPGERVAIGSPEWTFETFGLFVGRSARLSHLECMRNSPHSAHF